MISILCRCNISLFINKGKVLGIFVTTTHERKTVFFISKPNKKYEPEQTKVYKGYTKESPAYTDIHKNVMRRKWTYEDYTRKKRCGGKALYQVWDSWLVWDVLEIE